MSCIRPGPPLSCRRKLTPLLVRHPQFLVAKLIRLAPQARTQILGELMPHLPRLILHREAAGIIEDAFTLWCSGKERSSMMRPWWGKEGGLFYTE